MEHLRLKIYFYASQKLLCDRWTSEAHHFCAKMTLKDLNICLNWSVFVLQFCQRCVRRWRPDHGARHRTDDEGYVLQSRKSPQREISRRSSESLTQHAKDRLHLSTLTFPTLCVCVCGNWIFFLSPYVSLHTLGWEDSIPSIINTRGTSRIKNK